MWCLKQKVECMCIYADAAFVAHLLFESWSPGEFHTAAAGRLGDEAGRADGCLGDQQTLLETIHKHRDAGLEVHDPICRRRLLSG